MAIISVFGATGFVGQSLIYQLAQNAHEIHVLTRNLPKAQKLLPAGLPGQVRLYEYNPQSQKDISAALKESEYAINLCGILTPKKPEQFFAVHTELPKKIAIAAHENKLKKFIHLSAIGAHADSSSRYAQSKALGEQAALENFEATIILRPSLIVGPKDNFFNQFAQMASLSPILPMVGPKPDGCLFAPIYVLDVTKAIEACFNEVHQQIFEITGPSIYRWRELMQMTLNTIHKKRAIAYLPKWMLKMGGITSDHEPLFMQDNIASGNYKNLRDLHILPTDIKPLMNEILKVYI